MMAVKAAADYRFPREKPRGWTGALALEISCLPTSSPWNKHQEQISIFSFLSGHAFPRGFLILEPHHFLLVSCP